MKTIDAGARNKKVMFQNATTSDDGFNVETPSDDFYKWCKITSKKTDEVEQSGQLMTESTHTIECNYSPRITATHRLKHHDKKHNIVRNFEIIGEPINVNMANVTTLMNVKEITDA